MKNYTQVYVKDSLEAAKVYCDAFGAEITLEMKNPAGTAYEHCELSVGGEGFLALAEAQNPCDVAFLHKMKWETMTFNVFEMGPREAVSHAFEVLSQGAWCFIPLARCPGMSTTPLLLTNMESVGGLPFEPTLTQEKDSVSAVLFLLLFSRQSQEVRAESQQGGLSLSEAEQLQEPGTAGRVLPLFVEVRRKPDAALHSQGSFWGEAAVRNLLGQGFRGMEVGLGNHVWVLLGPVVLPGGELPAEHIQVDFIVNQRIGSAVGGQGPGC